MAKARKKPRKSPSKPPKGSKRRPKASSRKPRQKPKPKPKAKPRAKPAPKKRKAKQLKTASQWRDYFRDVLTVVGDLTGQPTKVRTWASRDRADALLYVQVPPDVSPATVQLALEEAVIDHVKSGEFWISWSWSGPTPEGRYRDRAQRSHSVETYPSKSLTTEQAADVFKSVKAYIKTDIIKLRLNWNEEDEQPERMA